MTQYDRAWVVTENCISAFSTVENAKNYMNTYNCGVLFTNYDEAKEEYYSLRDERNFFYEP